MMVMMVMSPAAEPSGCPYNNNNKKGSHTQLDSRKQVIAFQDRVITINIKDICYKAAAIGQSLIDGQEVHKVMLGSQIW